MFYRKTTNVSGYESLVVSLANCGLGKSLKDFIVKDSGVTKDHMEEIAKGQGLNLKATD